MKMIATSFAVLSLACGGLLGRMAGAAESATPTAPPATPLAAPAPPVVAPPYGLPIGLAQAKRIAAKVAEEAARENADRYVLAIVQPSGELVYFEKSDNSTFVSIDYAIAKARMSARYRTASGNLPPGASGLPDAISLTGGFPIVVGGRTIGAIGISGVERGGDVKLAQVGAGSLGQ